MPAQEGGVLTQINVRDGQQVQAGALLATIDDALPQMQRKIAAAEFRAAQERAANDVETRHAKAAAKVAESEYLRSRDAYRNVPGSVAEIDVQRLKFTWDRTILQIEQADKQRVLDSYTAAAKQAEVEAADEAIHRRKILSPIDGVVQKIYAHLGEWLKPGDSVLRLLRMDRLRVEGYLNKDEYNPAEVVDQPVAVEVALARGQKLQFAGRIVFVDLEVGTGGEYLVRAEVDNRKENGQWLLRPGLQGTMIIQLR